MTEKRFTSWGNWIKRNGKLLNIEFKTKVDAKLCCKLCNQMDKENQEYVDNLNEIFKWYKEYYGETILDTRMGWNDDNKISKLEKENEQLKFKLEEVRSDEKQLGISFMEFKMKLIEQLQIHYDYASEHRQKNLDNLLIAKAYDIICYDVRKLAEEMGVDLE